MIHSSIPSIVAVDRLNDGLVIKFLSGECALYTCDFLFSKLAECEQFNDLHTEW